MAILEGRFREDVVDVDSDGEQLVIKGRSGQPMPAERATIEL